MAWLVLIVSGVPGFFRLIPSVVFGNRARRINGRSGATLTVAYAPITGDEPFSVLKVLLVLGIVGCIF